MIHIESDPCCVRATLDAPATRNALDDRMLEGLLQALKRAEAEPGCRALVIRGAGATFCSGGDFGRFRALMDTSVPAGGADPIVDFNRAFGGLLERIVNASVATIAVVEGAAYGGGAGLAACCDFVLAESAAKFAMPEVTLGLPPAQIAPFVAARIGESNALRLMLTGRRIDAPEACALGLVDEVLAGASALEQRLADLLATLTRAEPAALRSTKAILQHRRRHTMAATLDFAAEQFAKALRSGMAGEGLAASAARRVPAWAAGGARSGHERKK